MLRTGLLRTRLRLRQSVVALCLFSAAFVAAFHTLDLSEAAWLPKHVAAVYADTDQSPLSSERLMVEGCHLCTVIASFDVQAVQVGHTLVLESDETRLVSFQPRMLGPPPKA